MLGADTFLGRLTRIAGWVLLKTGASCGRTAGTCGRVQTLSWAKSKSLF